MGREGRPIEGDVGVERDVGAEGNIRPDDSVGVEVDLGGMPVASPIAPPMDTPMLPPMIPPSLLPVAPSLPPPMDVEPMAPLPVPLPVPCAPKRDTSSSSFHSSTGGTRVSKEKMKDAAELTRFALRALEDRDSDMAVERLLGALAALGR